MKQRQAMQTKDAHSKQRNSVKPAAQRDKRTQARTPREYMTSVTELFAGWSWFG